MQDVLNLVGSVDSFSYPGGRRFSYPARNECSESARDQHGHGPGRESYGGRPRDRGRGPHTVSLGYDHVPGREGGFLGRLYEDAGRSVPGREGGLLGRLYEDAGRRVPDREGGFLSRLYEGPGRHAPGREGGFGRAGLRDNGPGAIRERY